MALPRKHAPTAHFWLTIAVLAIAVIAIVYSVFQRRDCDRRGGVLVRDALNMPVCVAGLTPR